MSVFAFIGILAVLLAEGCLLTCLLAPRLGWTLILSFALPVATVANVLLFFLFTLAHVPLAVWSILLGHAVIIGVTAFLLWRKGFKWSDLRETPAPPYRWTLFKKILIGVLGILTLNAFVFSAVHTLLVPSVTIDVFTNWTMRAKVSYQDRSMAFDKTEERGVAKPQYPFLVHALQITTNQGQAGWSDRMANTVTWLLSISSLAALFLVIRKLRDTFTATLTVGLLTQIPLLAVHLAQGYGDVHLVTYLALSFVTLFAYAETEERSWLLLSAACMLGAVWTKTEGLYIGLVPWAVSLLMIWRIHGGSLVRRWLIPVFSLALLFAPFLLFLTLKGLSLTPHQSDSTFGFHPEAVPMLFTALFGYGSFGILWYVLAPLVPWTFFTHRNTSSASLPLLVWGFLSFVIILIVYTCTPNVVYLLNGESFARQMLIPAALLVAWCALLLRPGQAD